MTTLHSRLHEATQTPTTRRLRPVRRHANPARPLVPMSIDVLAVGAVTITASLAAEGGHLGAGDPSMRWLVAFNLSVIVVLLLRGTYRFRLPGSYLDEMGSAIAATGIAGVTVLAAQALFSADRAVASHTALWAVVATLNLATVRAGAYVARRRRFRHGHGHAALIVGAGSVGRQLACRLLEAPELGLRPVGFLDKEPRSIAQVDLELPVLGASWDLEQQALAHDVDHVLVAFSTAPHHVLIDIIRRCHALKLHVLMVPRFFEEVPAGTNTEFAGGIPLLRIEPAARGWRLGLKYLIDRVVAGLALVVALPALLVVALLVRLSSAGPVFYRQRRTGLDGREFDMLKFRTMVGSPEVRGEADARWVATIVGGPEDGPVAAKAEDRRTPVGRILRKSSIDELPQLINVFRGDMSLVGPRPERATLVPLFNESVYRYHDRHRMKCGMTGLAQVNGLRGATSLADRIEWDNRYIQHWSLWLDLKILLRTLPAMLRGTDG